MGLTERGALVPMMLLALLSALPLSIALWSASSGTQAYRDQVGARLALARSALIEYAVTYPQNYTVNSAGPGHFPCPDTDGNGSPGPRCPPLAIGLLPRGFATSTGVSQDVQSDLSLVTEPLIWVVSGPFRNRPAPSGSPTHAMVLNSASEPVLQLDELTDVIGLLIAPGPPLSGQVRGADFRVSDYLEGENADGDSAFTRLAGNDRVLAVRWTDVMPLVERQVLAAVRRALVEYKQDTGRYPWLAAPASLDGGGNTHCEVARHAGWVSTPRYRAGELLAAQEVCTGVDEGLPQTPLHLPGWLLRNFWHTRIWLALDPGDGRVGPTLDGRAVTAVLAAAGVPLNPAPSGVVQYADPTQVGDLLDHAVNVDGDSAYRRAAGGNDQWLAIGRVEP